MKKAVKTARTLATQVADAILPVDFPSFTELMANDDHGPAASISGAFECLRDSHRGKSYDAWLEEISAAQEAIVKALPAESRRVFRDLCDQYGVEESHGVDAAFAAGVEVGKRLAGGAL